MCVSSKINKIIITVIITENLRERGRERILKVIREKQNRL